MLGYEMFCVIFLFPFRPLSVEFMTAPLVFCRKRQAKGFYSILLDLEAVESTCDTSSYQPVLKTM